MVSTKLRSGIERIRQTEKPTKAKAMTQRFGEREFSGDEVMHIKDLEKPRP